MDEAQDFTANQLRAVVSHLAPTHSLTCALDSMQRIYHRYFTWKEVGINATNATHRLSANYRNTKQIAAFARPLLNGIGMDGQFGRFPDFSSCTRDGELPIIVRGLFRNQLDYVLNQHFRNIDLTTESVAFLHPKGGGYFTFVRQRLSSLGYSWDELTQSSLWPTNNNSIALSTMHSAKGLEFDHVVVLGLDQNLTPHGEDEGDGHRAAVQRLVAMSIGRAKTTFVLGYKPGRRVVSSLEIRSRHIYGNYSMSSSRPLKDAEIAEFARVRGIAEILHSQTSSGLIGILASEAILARDLSPT